MEPRSIAIGLVAVIAAFAAAFAISSSGSGGKTASAGAGVKAESIKVAAPAAVSGVEVGATLPALKAEAKKKPAKKPKPDTSSSNSSELGAVDEQHDDDAERAVDEHAVDQHAVDPRAFDAEALDTEAVDAEAPGPGLRRRRGRLAPHSRRDERLGPGEPRPGRSVVDGAAQPPMRPRASLRRSW